MNSSDEIIAVFKHYHRELIHLRVFQMASVADMSTKFNTTPQTIKQIMKTCQKMGLVKTPNNDIFMLTPLGHSCFDIIDRVLSAAA